MSVVERVRSESLSTRKKKNDKRCFFHRQHTRCSIRRDTGYSLTETHCRVGHSRFFRGDRPAFSPSSSRNTVIPFSQGPAVSSPDGSQSESTRCTRNRPFHDYDTAEGSLRFGRFQDINHRGDGPPSRGLSTPDPGADLDTKPNGDRQTENW